MRHANTYLGAAAFVAGIPTVACALSVTQVPVALINVFLGVYMTVMLLMLCAGIAMYIGRIGTWPSNRDEAIRVFEWVVAMMFTLVVIVAVGKFVDRNPVIASRIAGVCVFGVVVWWGWKTYRVDSDTTEKPAEKKVGH